MTPRLERRDLSLFAAVPSETRPADRSALLAVQAAVRRGGDYVYLEIGSHLGGTLQPHCLDPRCRRIYSIDKRPEVVGGDVRGHRVRYEGNSTARMLAGLRAALGKAAVEKIVTFDADSAEVPAAGIAEPPRLCFIDGEHTTAAVLRDFAFCRRVAARDSVILFHDAHLMHAAIRECRRSLETAGVRHLALKLPGAVYAILLGAAIAREGAELRAVAQSDRWFRASAGLVLGGERLRVVGFRCWHQLVILPYRIRNWLRDRRGNLNRS